MKGIGILGCTPIRTPNQRAPNHQLTISCEICDEGCVQIKMDLAVLFSVKSHEFHITRGGS